MSSHRTGTSLCAAALLTLSLSTLTACGSSSGTQDPADSTGAGSAAASIAKSIDGCTLATAADLTQGVGVSYTKIESQNGGSLCSVTAASPTDSFSFHVDKEDGALTTWDGEVAIIKQDDGSVTSVSGVGDRAVQGAIKEFAAETKGYIVVVINADVNNSATAKGFTRSKAIAKTVIGKL